MSLLHALESRSTKYDGDNSDDKKAIYAIGDPARSLACRQMTGGKQGMDHRRDVAFITDTERRLDEVFRHRVTDVTSSSVETVTSMALQGHRLHQSACLTNIVSGNLVTAALMLEGQRAQMNEVVSQFLEVLLQLRVALAHLIQGIDDTFCFPLLLCADFCCR